MLVRQVSAMMFRRSVLVLATLFSAWLPLAAQAGRLVLFDPPGSFGTWPTATAKGWITGSFSDLMGAVSHGFVRDPQGQFTTFDLLPYDINYGQGTAPMAVNAAGTVAGFYLNQDGGWSGFTRDAQGQVQTFGVPGALWTQAIAMDDTGRIAGNYGNGTNDVHAFIRAPDGSFTTFDVGLATAVMGLDAQGNICGWWAGDDQVTHGFLRSADGVVTRFDVPGGVTVPYAIDQGQVVGSVGGGAFLRGTDGSITPIQPPGSIVVFATGIKGGTVAGYFYTGVNQMHGFERTPQGTYKVFDARPDAGATTQTTGIGAQRSVTGVYTDPKGRQHGFFGRP